MLTIAEPSWAIRAAPLDEPPRASPRSWSSTWEKQISRLKREGLTILLAGKIVDFSLSWPICLRAREGDGPLRGSARPFAPTSIRHQYLALWGTSPWEIAAIYPTQGPADHREALTPYCRAAEARQVALGSG